MCGLTGTPRFLKTFKQLEYFDGRNNSIIKMPDFPKAFVESKKSQIYLEGNPLCADDSRYCYKSCSVYCYSDKPHSGFGTDNFCDPTCDSKDCDYDGGDCQI